MRNWASRAKSSCDSGDLGASASSARIVVSSDSRHVFASVVSCETGRTLSSRMTSARRSSRGGRRFASGGGDIVLGDVVGTDSGDSGAVVGGRRCATKAAAGVPGVA